MKSTLPNFFIIGTPKAGTTALQKMLATHPDVYMSPIKEPHYFSKDFNPKNFAPDYRRNTLCDISDYLKQTQLKELHLAHVPNWEQYIQLYRNVEKQRAIGEASSGYLYSNSAAENIYNKNPGAKIIIILRAPVDRAYSHFCMDKASGRISTNSFVTAVKNDYANPTKAWGGKHLYVELGLYYEQIQRYLATFPQRQVKIIAYNDWLKNNKRTLNEIADFLNIATDKCLGIGQPCNKSLNTRFTRLHYLFTLTRFRETQRAALPGSIRRVLKKTWFSSSPRETLSSKDRETVSYFFREDNNKLQQLFDTTKF